MIEIYSFTYSVPYLIVAMLLIFLSFLEQRNLTNELVKKRIRIVCCVVFILFFALRGFVAYDWYGYYDKFNSTGDLLNLSLADFISFVHNDVYEPFFVIYTSLIKTIWDNWAFYVFLSSLIDLIILDYAFKKYSPNYAFSMLLFFSLNLALPIDLMRNFKALLFFILSLESIHSKQFLKFFLFSLLGFMFHRSMIILFGFYFISDLKFNKRLLIYLLIIVNAIYFSQIGLAHLILGKAASLLGGVFESKAYWYSISDIYGSGRGFTLGYFYRTFVYFLIIAYHDRIIALFKYGRIFINMYLTYYVVTIGLSDFRIFTDRAEILFSISIWFLWPLLVLVIRDLWFRRVVFACMLLFCFLRVYKQTNNFMYEYENVLTGTSTYEERINTHFKHKHLISEKEK